MRPTVRGEDAARRGRAAESETMSGEGGGGSHHHRQCRTSWTHQRVTAATATRTQRGRLGPSHRQGQGGGGGGRGWRRVGTGEEGRGRAPPRPVAWAAPTDAACTPGAPSCQPAVRSRPTTPGGREVIGHSCQRPGWAYVSAGASGGGGWLEGVGATPRRPATAPGGSSITTRPSLGGGLQRRGCPFA